MKLIVQVCRVLTGLLFIFSGVIKLNDPSGFSIKLNEYFDVFSEDVSTRQDTLTIALTESGKTLGSKAFILYSFDTERELTIATEVEQEEADSDEPQDSVKKQISYTLHVDATLEEETAVSADFSIPDSAAKVVITAKASISGKSIFQKDYHLGIGETLDSKNKLALKEFVKKESWLNGFFKYMKNWTLWLSVFICALEVILGFALIVGWSMRLTSTLLLLLIVFFTFLTFYAAYFNKVTDCGCFGDFLKLKPWHSFLKDLILLVLIVVVFIGRNHIKPWFSKKFGWKFISFISLLSVGFGVYCYMYLPVWDFLPFKKGNNIYQLLTEVPKGQRASDSVAMTYVMHKGTDSVMVPVPPYDAYTKYVKDSWQTGRRIDKVIIEGYHWPIHDFAINNPATGNDLKDSFLTYTNYQLVLTMPFTDDAYQGANKNIKEISDWAKTKGLPFYPLSSSATDVAKEYVEKNQFNFTFYSADWKMLMTMGRYNPTLYLFKGPVVVKKWSGRNLPSVKRLEMLSSK